MSDLIDGSDGSAAVRTNLRTKIHQLGWDILIHLQADAPSPTAQVISPFSIMVALAMLAGGADAGKKAQLCSKMGIKDPSILDHVFAETIHPLHSGQPLQVANGAFVDGTAVPKIEYLKFLESFEAEFRTYPKLEHEADSINEWISDHTHGLIKNMLSRCDLVNSQLILVNALAYKGLWDVSFEPEQTKKEYPFHLSGNETRPVDMMFLHNTKILVATHDECIVVRLPYQHNEDLPEIFFEAYLPARDMTLKDIMAVSSRLIANFHLTNITDFGIPKFESETTKDIASLLDTLGYPLDGSWPGMLEDNSPLLGLVLHKAVIKVDEKGTVAAAATVIAGRGGRGIMSVRSRSIIFDRPFAYSILDDTGIVYFTGIFT